MAKFDGVIFDWAGTTVDYGCFAPVQAFADSSAEFGVIPTMDGVRAPSGDAEAGSCAHYAADGTDFRIVETGSWPRIHRRGRRGSVSEK